MKMFSLSATVAAVLAASLSLSACGGGGGGGSDGPPGVTSSGGNPGNTAGAVAGGTGGTGTSSGSGSAQGSGTTQGAGAGSDGSSTTTTGLTSSTSTPAGITALQSAIERSSANTPSTVSGIGTETDSGTSVSSLSQGAGPSTPTGVSIHINELLGPTVINLHSGVLSVDWREPVSIETGRYDGFRMTRPGGEIMVSGNPAFHTTDGIPETAWVWTDIEDPSYVDFEEVYPLDYDSDSDNTNDSLNIIPTNVHHVTHIGRQAEDMREGDDSVGAVDRGILGQDTTFSRGHEIGARFDGAYGIYTCVASSCNINMPFPRDGDLSMSGWVFMPKDETGSGGGTRPPQVPVYDTDYRYFGLWLRGPYNTSQFDIETFAGGSEEFAGTVTQLAGRATYVGPARGQYVWDTEDTTPHSGLFKAQVTLHAAFGAQPKVSGVMDHFTDKDNQNLGWSLFFDEAPITGTTFSGTTSANSRGALHRGSYKGGLYGNDTSGYPTAAVGTFTGTFDEGLVIGSFGTYRHITPP